MMNHDPFQTYQAGAYSGGVTPFLSPYAQIQNPALLGLTGLQNPMLQNPILQNPMVQHALLQQQLQQLAWQQQNPFGQGHIWPQHQQPFGNPYATQGYPLGPQGLIGGGLGQIGGFGQQSPFGHQGGYGQQGGFGQQGFGQQGGFGQPYSQIHPLAQLALRQAAGYGISPYGGGF